MTMKNSGIVLFVCAGLLLGSGSILGASAGWSLMRMSYHFWTTELGVELSCAVLLVAGSVLCLPTCWLATVVPYYPRATSPLITLMFLTTCALLLLSSGMSTLTSLSSAVRDHHAVNATMHNTMARVPLDYSYWVAFNSMQLELRCCGVQGYTDWYKHGQILPAACCNRWTVKRQHDSCEKTMYTNGCLVSALVELRYFANTMTAFACVNIVVLAVTLFAAAYSLVTSVIERGDLSTLKSSIRLACVHAPAGGQTPFLSIVTPANTAPLTPMAPIGQSLVKAV